MEEAFQQLFRFTDYVLAHAGQILLSFVVILVLLALAKAVLKSIVGGTAEVFGLSNKGKKGKARRKKAAEDEEDAVGVALSIGKVVQEEVEKEIGTKRERRRKKAETAADKPAEPQPQPIMVAHPLDIKDEASRRLFEEEVEKEKEQMRLRAKSE